MIHIIQETASHTETLESVVATCERLEIPYRIYFSGAAIHTNRFEVKSFRPFQILKVPEELQKHLLEGDVVFFVTIPLGKELERWTWLNRVSLIRVAGINHQLWENTPSNWNVLILTQSPHNPIDHAHPYFQVEEPDGYSQSNDGVNRSLPRRFFLMVGMLNWIVERTSIEFYDLAKSLPAPIVCVGNGSSKSKDALSGLGPVFSQVNDRTLHHLAKQSLGVISIADPRVTPAFKKKISGCFSLAIRNHKALIASPEYLDAHGYTNGISIYDSKKISEKLLDEGARLAQELHKELCDRNSLLFNGLIQKRVVIMPPTPRGGSLGDEAIVHSVVREFQKQKIPVNLVRVGAKLRKKLPVNFDGTPLFTENRIGHHECVVACGADVLDGRYGRSEKLKELLQTVENLHVVGISAKNDWFFEGTETASISVRDKETHEVLQNYPITRCADPAFLLKQRKPPLELLRWVKESPGHVIGMNLPSEKVADFWIQFLKQRWPNVSIVPVPHDFRGDHIDVRIAKKLTELAKTNGLRVWDGEPVRAADQVKGLCSHLDLVISARMHLCIASLGTGTPVVTYTYDSKFEELTNLFGDRVLIQPENSPVPTEEVSRMLEGRFESEDPIESVSEMSRVGVPKLEFNLRWPSNPVDCFDFVIISTQSIDGQLLIGPLGGAGAICANVAFDSDCVESLRSRRGWVNLLQAYHASGANGFLVLRDEKHQCDEIWEAIRRASSSLRVVVTHRQDLLRGYVSLKIAKEATHFPSTKDTAQVVVDWSDFAQFCERYWNRMNFAYQLSKGKKFIPMTLENILMEGASTEYISKILDYDFPANATPNSTRREERAINEIISNWDEIVGFNSSVKAI